MIPLTYYEQAAEHIKRGVLLEVCRVSGSTKFFLRTKEGSTLYRLNATLFWRLLDSLPLVIKFHKSAPLVTVYGYDYAHRDPK